MKAMFILGGAALAVSAVPALANETRFEGRGGVIWDQGDSEAIAGLAAGYDFDLAGNGFVGIEVSGDKVLEDNTRVSFGIGGRVGARVGMGKLYAVSTYQTKPCRFCKESVSLGAGYQHPLGDTLYAKVEYRHFFVGDNVSDPDSVTAGLGVKF